MSLIPSLSDARAELFFSRYSDDFVERLEIFHAKNPKVWSRFVEMATHIKATGRKHYSAGTIIDVIRWEADIATTGDTFKINNDFGAVYVRALVYYHPDFEGFFEFRHNAPNLGRKSQEQLSREAVQ